MDMTGLREIQPKKRAMDVHYLNASQAHLREAEQEQKAPQPRRAARAGRVLPGIEEHLDRFKASLKETREALQQTQQTLRAI